MTIATVLKFYSAGKLISKIYNVAQIIRVFIICGILNILVATNSYAEKTKDTLDSIIDILSGLTCETQGVGDLLRTEFSHTCIPAPFFTFIIANTISPGLYADTMLRLKINDHELFDVEYPNGGQCARNNRVDPNDLKLTFALCDNVKLATVRMEAIALSAIAIAKATLTGNDPWDDIKKSWGGDKSKFHTIYKDKRDGDFGVMIDTPFPIPFKVVKRNDTMCVAAPTILADWVAVGCKYIKEPYPQSIYARFMSLDSVVAKDDNVATDPMAIVDCGLSSSSCYQRAYNNSKTAIVITAPLIECVKEMTARLLISKDVCRFDDISKVINSSKRESSTLFQFQRNMHRTVIALLTIYVIFFGFKIVLSGDVPPKNEIINFILKMLFVIYFAIGININPTGGSDYDRLDGMVQWAFPLLLGGIDTLASWVISVAPSELCKFSDMTYEPSLASNALWDALDCRVSHYLGLDALSTLLEENQARSHDFSNFDFFSFSAPPYVYLLVPAIITGNMMLVSLALAYPLLVISVAAFMVNATVMCMISIVILSVLAPLFVPMFLFEYTRGYFESWVKLLISFLLQPMVVVTFMIVMFSVYDFGFYGHCKYKSQTVTTSSVTDADGKRDVKIFYVNNNWDDYTEDEAKSCKNSLGYLLNNPLSLAFDFTKGNIKDIVKEKPGTISTVEYLAKFSFLQGVITEPGMFFASPKLIFEKIKDIILALITACFTLYLMYHFSAGLAEFAADMTEGVALTNIAINPQAIFKAGMAAIPTRAKGAVDKMAGGATRAGDLVAGGEAKATDSASGGRNLEAEDIVSSGTAKGSLASDIVSSESKSSANEIQSQNDISDSKSSLDELNNVKEERINIEQGVPIKSENLDIVGSATKGESLPKSPREKLDHSIKMGEAGYVKQEIRNHEAQIKNSALDVLEQKSLNTNNLPTASVSKTKFVQKDNAIKIDIAKKGDSDENI